MSKGFIFLMSRGFIFGKVYINRLAQTTDLKLFERVQTKTIYSEVERLHRLQELHLNYLTVNMN